MFCRGPACPKRILPRIVCKAPQKEGNSGTCKTIMLPRSGHNLGADEQIFAKTLGGEAWGLMKMQHEFQGSGSLAQWSTHRKTNLRSNRSCEKQKRNKSRQTRTLQYQSSSTCSERAPSEAIQNVRNEWQGAQFTF